MAPWSKKREAGKHRRRSPIPQDFATLDRLTDNGFRGVAASRTHLGRSTALVCLVEREFICSSPDEDQNRQD